MMKEMSRYLCAAVLLAGALSGAEFRVSDFGARGDGVTVNTAAIQKALDAAAAARGTVVLAPGVYLTGALFLKSGSHLRIDSGVELRGVQIISAYPEMPTRIAGVEMTWPTALLNVYRQDHVRISGKGIVDGNGKAFWDLYWKMRKEEYEPKGVRWAVDYDCRRPRLIQVFDSHDVDLEDLTLQRSGFWTVHVCYSRRVKVSGISIRNNIGGHGPSTDGIDIDSSSEVLVERCDIDCNDDAICLKAGRDADGLRVNRPTEKVRVRDCTVRGGAAGITIGSETSGGIRDIDAAGIRVLTGVPNGILFKSASTRGGLMERISVKDMVMEGVGAAFAVALNWNPSYSYAKLPADTRNVPSYWRTLAEPVPPEKGLPRFQNVRISDIRATGGQRAFAVSSYPEAPLRNFHFEDIDIEAKSAGSIQHAEDWTFVTTRIRTQDGSRVVIQDSRAVKGLDEAMPSPRQSLCGEPRGGY